ncbi:ABC transporter substrate-binding protein [Candidatus Aerophobetes bacterium]|uniref:ABC transporter substrate-binding protein n=1 Tax=Aerophobetes bacterium TaxID=2030807 RepID=A0A523RP76_UNCAE|nr:MAG: ABC transporter substrate-binding protein [Candidatus Aerophobetes bacterium]
MRKLIIILLIGAISVWGIVPALAQELYELKEYEQLIGEKLEFHEAPELRAKVAAGELPSVEKRLPEDPLVVKPLEEIGQYGGTWRRVARASHAWVLWYYIIHENEIHYSADLTHIVPSLVKDFKASEDSKSFIFYLRKGLKWSDGNPVTADDYVFWWDHIILDDDLSPTKPKYFLMAGELAEFKKIDDYTIEWSFSQPNSMFLDILAGPRRYSGTGSGKGYWCLPEHHLRQFHPEYTPMDTIEKQMKEEGFDTWIDFFSSKMETLENLELPHLNAWGNLDYNTGAMQRFVRNPYYWKVDTKGNQLPYIDKIQVTFVADAEAVMLKAVAGDIDFQYRDLTSSEKYTTLMKNREKGDYRVVLAKTNESNKYPIFFNLSSTDPVLRKLFLDIKFRMALSLAIDRQEINNTLEKGLCEVRQMAFLPPGEAAYDERTATLYTEYTPEKANELLDEIGLGWDKNHEYRLRSDGEELKLTNVLCHTGFAVAMEMIKNDWKKIGVKMVIKTLERSVWQQLILNQPDKYDLTTWWFSVGGLAYPPINSQVWPGGGGNWFVAPQWDLWLETEGKAGEKPELPVVDRLQEIYVEGIQTTSAERRSELVKEGYRIFNENLLAIGILDRGIASIYYVVKNSLRNVPETLACDDTTFFQPSSFFFKE